MAFLDHIHDCNRWHPADFQPFVVAGERLGWVRRGFARALAGLGGDFGLADDALHWRTAPAGFDARTEAFAAQAADWDRRGLISHLHGERYPVLTDMGEPRLLMDRAVAPYFGIRAFGQHMNGYVRREDGLHLWVGKRSGSRRVEPGKLDHIVAGGLPWGIGLQENLRKECWEEASLPAAIADRARPVGIVSYCRDSDRGLKPDTIYCYDLELPEGITPRCNDDEVESFRLLPAAEVMRIVDTTDDFKLNCNLVIIDFLIRHGLITPEHPDYLAIASGLRATLPSGQTEPS
jgi:8-oxo-dGTP pyrophosphatase MutT (NUDIX family)